MEILSRLIILSHVEFIWDTLVYKKNKLHLENTSNFSLMNICQIRNGYKSLVRSKLMMFFWWVHLLPMAFLSDRMKRFYNSRKEIPWTLSRASVQAGSWKRKLWNTIWMREKKCWIWTLDSERVWKCLLLQNWLVKNFWVFSKNVSNSWSFSDTVSIWYSVHLSIAKILQFIRAAQKSLTKQYRKIYNLFLSIQITLDTWRPSKQIVSNVKAKVEMNFLEVASQNVKGSFI